jgi:hypothetical protein
MPCKILLFIIVKSILNRHTFPNLAARYNIKLKIFSIICLIDRAFGLIKSFCCGKGTILPFGQEISVALGPLSPYSYIISILSKQKIGIFIRVMHKKSWVPG